MNPSSFGQAAEERSYFVELVMIARPFNVLFEAQLFLYRHRAMPTSENQWGYWLPSPLRSLTQIPEPPVKLCPFWRHWHKTFLRGTVLPKQIEGFYRSEEH